MMRRGHGTGSVSGPFCKSLIAGFSRFSLQVASRQIDNKNVYRYLQACAQPRYIFGLISALRPQLMVDCRDFDTSFKNGVSEDEKRKAVGAARYSQSQCRIGMTPIGPDPVEVRAEPL